MVAWCLLAFAPAVTGCIWLEAPVSGAAASESKPFVLEFLVREELHGPGLAGATITGSTWRLAPCHNWPGEVCEYPGGEFSLTTDAGGRARLEVADGRRAWFEVRLPGYTVERGEVAAPEERGGTVEVEVPLFHERLQIVVHGRLEGAGPGSPAFGEFQWWPQELDWGKDPATLGGYVARILSIHVVLTWNNTPTSWADLGLAIGDRPEEPDAIADAKDQLAPGSYNESVGVDLHWMYRAGWGDAEKIYVGAGTREPHAAPLGLDYTIHVEAVFSTDRPAATPGPPIAGVLAVVGAAALVLAGRRRRA